MSIAVPTILCTKGKHRVAAYDVTTARTDTGIDARRRLREAATDQAVPPPPELVEGAFLFER